MSSGGGGGGYQQQPQDNTSALIAAQMEAQQRQADAQLLAQQQAQQQAIIQWQEQVDNDKHNAQVAENTRIQDRDHEEAMAAAAQQKIWDHEAALKADADAKVAADKKYAADKETARIAAANQAKTTVDSSARASATARLNSLNASDILPQAMSQYDRILAGIPEGDPNPGAYYSSDILDSLISGAQTQRRDSYTSAVNNTFAPGFEQQYIPDTADDSYIDKLLTGRQGEAQKSIDFARARGQLNDAGYSSAKSKLDEQSTAARGTLNSIGNSILSTKRAALDPIRDQAYGAASSFNLGDTAFDISPYSNRAASQAQSSLSGLEGDISGALGNTSLFNVNDIILAGGRGQGPQNLTTAAIPARLKKTDTDRGLGTTGAF